MEEIFSSNKKTRLKRYLLTQLHKGGSNINKCKQRLHECGAVISIWQVEYTALWWRSPKLAFKAVTGIFYPLCDWHLQSSPSRNKTISAKPRPPPQLTLMLLSFCLFSPSAATRSLQQFTWSWNLYYSCCIL